MAETTGVSRSASIWATVQGSQAEVEALVRRRFDDLKLLAVYGDRLNEVVPFVRTGFSGF